MTEKEQPDPTTEGALPDEAVQPPEDQPAESPEASKVNDPLANDEVAQGKITEDEADRRDRHN